VLTDRRSTAAATSCRLKENVIIGKLIPAGTESTGTATSRCNPPRRPALRVHDPVLRGSVLQPGLRQATGAAVPLDDYGYSDYR